MPRKVVILLLAAAVTANSGCQTKPRDEPQPVAAKVAATPTPTPRQTPTPRKPPTPAPAAVEKPTPSPPQQASSRNEDLSSLIKGETRWADNRREALIVTDQRGAAATEPVPLFRQAIVIASVRSAVAGSAAAPEASFRNGQLTLTFRRGTSSEVAAAVNRALAVPEVGRLVVVPPAN